MYSVCQIVTYAVRGWGNTLAAVQIKCFTCVMDRTNGRCVHYSEIYHHRSKVFDSYSKAYYIFTRFKFRTFVQCLRCAQIYNVREKMNETSTIGTNNYVHTNLAKLV